MTRLGTTSSAKLQNALLRDGHWDRQDDPSSNSEMKRSRTRTRGTRGDGVAPCNVIVHSSFAAPSDGCDPLFTCSMHAIARLRVVHGRVPFSIVFSVPFSVVERTTSAPTVSRPTAHFCALQKTKKRYTGPFVWFSGTTRNRLASQTGAGPELFLVAHEDHEQGEGNTSVQEGLRISAGERCISGRVAMRMWWTNG